MLPIKVELLRFNKHILQSVLVALLYLDVFVVRWRGGGDKILQDG